MLVFTAARQHSLLAVVLSGLIFSAALGQAAWAQPAEVTIAVDPQGAGGAHRTIGSALEAAQAANNAGASVRVRIAAGLYREGLRIGGQQGSAPLVIEGAAGGGTIITGADRWDGWQPQGGGLFSHEWSHRWGQGALPDGWGDWWRDMQVDDLLRRRELVATTGRPLEQVGSRDRAAGTDGSFFVDEGAGRLFVNPEGDYDLAERGAEVGVRRSVFEADGMANLTLSNLSFRYAASGVSEHAVRISNSPNVKVVRSRFEWNNWGGVQILTSPDSEIRGSTANDNGVMGFSGYRLDRFKLLASENSYNNWRGAQHNYFDWEAGNKFLAMRDMVISGFRAVGNRSHGLWLDFDNANILIEDAFIAGNENFGMFLEASQGPMTVRNSVVCDNHVGIFDGRVNDVTLEGNQIFDNDVQLRFSGDGNGRWVTPFDGGGEQLVHSTGWRIQGNTFAASVPGSNLVGTTIPGSEWDMVRESMRSTGNTWHHSAPGEPFQTPAGRFNFSGWQSHTGQDRDSSFSTSPSGLSCAAPSGNKAPAAPAPVAPAPSAPQPTAPPVTPGDGPAFRRIFGQGRIETAVALSGRELGKSVSTVLLARSDEYADALAAAPLAAREDAPILLTGGDRLDPAAAARIAEVGARRVILLGGNAALSSAVEQAVWAVPGVTSVERIAGSSRFGTAAEIAKRIGGQDVYIAEGSSGWPDAVSVSGLAAREQRPILLTTKDGVPEETWKAFIALGVGKVTLVGGRAVVSQEVEDILRNDGKTVERLSGADRYATSRAIAEQAVGDSVTGHRVWLATGRSWPDALAAAPAASADQGVLLLIDGAGLAGSTATADWVASGSPSAVTIVGGASAVSDGVLRELAGRLGSVL